jgi:hypothetical protein
MAQGHISLLVGPCIARTRINRLCQLAHHLESGHAALFTSWLGPVVQTPTTSFFDYEAYYSTLQKL